MKKYLLICSLFGLAGNNCLAMKIVKSEKNIKNKNNASILDVLPPEIIVDILEKTDVQTVGRAARTCKTMRALA
ncbi:MAG: F-box-like domain-containing protein, partial [bacterium]|nr:F-box-like domain-containing protein [bacterium]